MPNKPTTRAQRLALKKRMSKHPKRLRKLPESLWPPWRGMDENRIEVWLSRFFLVQVFAEESGAIRLSINRCKLEKDGSWSADVSWEELQQIKRECGFGDKLAVEIYPADIDGVNLANMRHLWVPAEEVKGIGWKR